MKYGSTMMDLYNHPRTGRRAKELIARVLGTEPEFMDRLVTEEDLARAACMSFDELADEALHAKTLD